jgi:predicted nucleic acid-binding protein
VRKVILDTDIIIDFIRAERGPLSELIELQSLHDIELYLSSITVMELFAGQSSQENAAKLEKLIDKFRIVAFDKVLARFTGEFRRGKKLDLHFADFIIGATAVWLKAQLATGNKKHFQGIPGLKFFNLPG